MDEVTEDNEKVKIVVIGDGSVGKTSMIMCYAHDKFPDSHIPTVFDNHKGITKFNNEEVLLDIWDTAGQKDLGRLRPCVYPGTNIFCVCFSLVDRYSFENACKDWISELRN